MFLPNPGILAAGVSITKTYPQFLAHITLLATNGERAWDSSSLAGGTDQRTHRTAPSMADLSGLTMTGSSWGPLSPAGLARFSSPARAMQHALPNEALFNALRSTGYEILYTVSAASSAAVSPSTRNGYTSLGPVTTNVSTIPEVIYYDPTLGPMRMQPHLGLGPTPYDWT